MWNPTDNRLEHEAARCYLLILVDDVCREALVDNLGEDGGSWRPVPPAGLLRQAHLVPSGAQSSLETVFQYSLETGVSSKRE